MTFSPNSRIERFTPRGRGHQNRRRHTLAPGTGEGHFGCTCYRPLFIFNHLAMSSGVC